MNLFFLIVAFCYIQTVTSLFCFWNTGCPYKYFSTKTPYNSVRGDIRDGLVKLTDCEPISIWALLKHGKRNPGTEFEKPMKEAVTIRDLVAKSYESGSSSLCSQDVDNLRDWVEDQGIFDKPFQLTKEGFREMEGIGRRMKQAFPKLLGNLDKDDYDFRHANETWVADSAKSFIAGLNIKQPTIQPYDPNSNVVSPYKNCAQYENIIRDPKTYAESAKYQSTSEYLAAKDRIQRRLGIDYLLTNTNVSALYDLCRYTSSGLRNEFSPWCALFTTEDLKIMEYISDLRHYYESGYGTPMNKLFGQVTLADLLKSFQAAKDGNGKKIIGYIGQSTILDMVYTALNLFKDDKPLTGAQRKVDRKWRSSKAAVFSSNLIAVLNKCKKGESDDYNVVFYLNEEPLISICKQGVCTWKELENKLLLFLETKLDFC